MKENMQLKWTDHSDLAIKKEMGIGREKYLNHMTFKSNESPLFTEIFGPLIGLKEEWERQGATTEELDFSAFRYRCPQFVRIPVNTGWLGSDKEQGKVLEENEDYRITVDQMGRRMKLSKKASTLPIPLDYPLQKADDWNKVKRHYQFSEKRFGENWKEQALRGKEEGKVVTVGVPGGFDEPRQLMGEERLCKAYYQEPQLMEDVLETIGDMTVKVLKRIIDEIELDQLSIHEDMAGKGGPLVGPRQIEDFIGPYYGRNWEVAQAGGARLFDQDSDGDMRPIVPQFLDAGVNVTHPMEPAAGMDIVELREQYGERLAFYGGIDKHVLRKGKGAITEELEYKIPPMIQSGGCMLGLDHRIPNGTPLEAYRFYIDRAWDIMERETENL